MSSEMKIDEAKLLAWHHGELGAEEAAAVKAALAKDPAAQALLASWRAQDVALSALYAPVAEEPVPPHLTEALTPRRIRLTPVAAMLGMLAVGLAGGWFAARLTAPGLPGRSLAAEAIAAHETYVVEVVHPVEVAAAEEAHLTGWISKRLGHRIAPPNFSAEGFHLIGGRVLPGESAAAAMLMYEDDFGRRLTLYVTPTPDKAETAFRFTGDGAVQSFWWTDKGFYSAVVGEVPRALLRKIALAAYDQLI